MLIAAILKHKGTEVVSVAPADRVVDVVRILDQRRIGAALVRDAEGRIIGIISERDIIRGMAGHGQGTSQLPAEQLMTRDLVTVTPETLVVEALGLMTNHRVRHLPVLVDGQLAGLVSIGDLVKARIEEAEYETETLKTYVASAG
ncbi:CBS domain-containing protein [Siccirubricoccus sp. G192]|uniref:CBS domain-containing protein n=1 Tax=Siccirubricoccus sp. G192 TaxID=2849651 RepID=UPI001C2CACA0|nr:CBS domain-containing protein [Siccirubricoccus sp. G192]MBV1795579.1 CBS domain-containing protein [Siccirubricoccus sp. G192]MBV1800256.1 CBS domain-containing protein [Siccirubricoccus sp. G192]